jgi:hypothetical protein
VVSENAVFKESRPSLAGFASRYYSCNSTRLIDAVKLRVTEVLVRQNDAWKLIHSHADTDADPQ